VPAEWNPARRAQIDRDGRWTIKRDAGPGDGHKRQVEIAVPVFGYKNHVGIRSRIRLSAPLRHYPRGGA
jgi:transposase, IS5 family